MKIISLSSKIAGPACGIATSVKKYFYNNEYKTNFFDYLEISLYSILEILSIHSEHIREKLLNNENNIENNMENNIENNMENNSNINGTSKNDFIKNDNNTTVFFKYFNKILSHHDLPLDYNEDDYNNLIDKYERRHKRLYYDIKNEDEIYFIRFGNEDSNLIYNFIEKIKELNPNLKFTLVHLIYDENMIDYMYDNKYICINLYYHIDKNKIYSEDLYFKMIEMDWKFIYDKIYEIVDIKYKESFIFY
jgi:hypothetical protein